MKYAVDFDVIIRIQVYIGGNGNYNLYGFTNIGEGKIGERGGRESSQDGRAQSITMFPAGLPGEQSAIQRMEIGSSC